MIRRYSSRIITAAAILLILLIPRQGKGGGGHIESKSLVVDGVERKYALYIPGTRGGRERTSLVIVLHGAFGYGGIISDYTGINERAEQRDFIAAYPESFGPYWNDGRADENSFAYRKNINDVRFISGMIDAVVAEYPVDPGRVYAIGFSNGGMMAHRLAIEMSEKFAAVASVSGTIPLRLIPGKRGMIVPIIMFHGTEDRTVPWKGGMLGKGSNKHGEVLSVLNTVLYWSIRNGCAGRPLLEVVPDIDPNDGTIAFLVTFCEKRPDDEVQLYSIKGGGHTWPGTKIILPAERTGRTSKDVNATDIILEFFGRHRRVARTPR